MCGTERLSAKPGTAVPRKLAFFWQQKKACKENCRCCECSGPRLRGCTPLRTPIRKSEGPMAKRTQYYCPFLTPSALPPLLSREFPRTPAGGRWRPPCQRGLAALADWGIPTAVRGRPFPGNLRTRKRAGLPPSLAPLVHNLFTPPGRGRACPARSLAITTPFILCIVGRGLDRLTAHNERRQPAKLARSCGCLPCRGKHCSLPDFAPLNRGPTLTTPHLRGASGTPPPTKQSAGLLITANVRGGLGAGRPTSHFTTFRGAGLRPQLIHATL